MMRSDQAILLESMTLFGMALAMVWAVRHATPVISAQAGRFDGLERISGGV
ncbi:MAG TPA: hypothetical protein VI702_00065 [Nitrospiria bacterium]